MLTLGIETSCDETGVSVAEGRRVLSNAVSSSVHLHKKYGGVVPNLAKREHQKNLPIVLDEALKKAKTNYWKKSELRANWVNLFTSDNSSRRRGLATRF